MKPLGAEAIKENSLRIRKILVGVDLSDHSEATASYAAEMAQAFGASLTIVYVYEPIPLCEYASETTFTLLEEQRFELEKLLNELTQKVQKIAPVCRSVFLVGEPAKLISTLAKDINADLIVVANHHPTSLGQLFNVDKLAPELHLDLIVISPHHHHWYNRFRQTDNGDNILRHAPCPVVSGGKESRRGAQDCLPYLAGQSLWMQVQTIPELSSSSLSPSLI
jgi:nucleotide-binding universal stress UspA family protein